jgi:hypothetical protein
MPEDIEKGLIYKSAEVEVQDVDEAEIKKINKYTLTPVTAEDVFTFKVIAGDNELDDRNFEPFNLNALKDLAKLYPGKPVIKDHRRNADNQVARVYDAELISDGNKTTGAGEQFTKLLLKCYMVKTPSNADLITEIKAGIKKEVSTGMRAKKAICSICGTDNTKSYCPHWPGIEYDKEDGKHVCYFTLDGAKEAYELSLVAVPAQPRAGTCKDYGAEKPEQPAEEPPAEEPAENGKNEALTLSIENVGAFLFAKKSKLKLEE